MQALNTAILIIFTGLVVAGAGRTLYRVYEYRRAGRPLPQLLVRDVISRNSLAFSFILILAVRAFSLRDIVFDELWWTLITAVPAIYGAAVYAYYEYFVIDKHAPGDDPDIYDVQLHKMNTD